MKHTYHFLLAFLLVASLSFTSEAQEKEGNPLPDRPYDVLLVKPAGGIQVEVVDASTGEVVFTKDNEHRYPSEAIEWALSQSHVTALVDGKFKLHNTLRVPVSNTSLIVGPNAELAVKDPYIPTTGFPKHKPIIKVIRRDNVKVFTLGTLFADWEDQIQMDGPRGDRIYPAWGGVMFDGRNGGKTGIDGGLLFATGTLKNLGLIGNLTDTKNVSIPLIWGRSNFIGNTVVNMEGNEDTEIGLAAVLRPRPAKEFWPHKDQVTNEVIDLNYLNSRTRIHRIIGTWNEGQQEFLDVNNSPKTILNKLEGYGKVGQSKEELIGHKGNFVDIHSYGKDNRFTQKPGEDNNSPGTEIKNVRIINKNVKTWKTEVETPGFPDNLPELNINVRLTAVFEDGSTEQVFANKYRYDLTEPSGK